MFEPWQVELVEDCRVARLATVSSDGHPHLVPVCFSLVEDRFALPIDAKPKTTTRLARLRNVQRDPRVSLLFDRYDDDWSRLAWVRVEGRAEVLAKGSAWPEALAALRLRYSQYSTMALELLPLLVVAVDRVVGWRWDGLADVDDAR